MSTPNHNNHPQRRSNWMNVWNFWTATWQRSLLALGFLIALAISGIVLSIFNLILVKVIIPIIILWCVVALFRPNRRGSGH